MARGTTWEWAEWADASWVSFFQRLAARKATLRRALASIYDPSSYGDQKEPWSEEKWREQWERQVSESFPPLDGDWPWSLWLDFGTSPVPRLSGPGHGEGLELTLEAVAPEVDSKPDAVVRDLTGVAPFAPVVGTTLNAMSVLAWPAVYEPRREGRPRLLGTIRAALSGGPSARRVNNAEPVELVALGMRLQFGGGEVWIFDIADELEIYGRRPGFLDDREYDHIGEYPAQNEG